MSYTRSDIASVATAFLALVAAPMLGACAVTAGMQDKDADGQSSSGLVQAVAVSADGGLVAAAYSRSVIRLWDVHSRSLQRTVPVSVGNRGTLPCFAFSRDLRVALVGQDDTWCGGGGDDSPIFDAENALTVWDLSAGLRARALSTKGRAVVFVAVSPDGSRALASSASPCVAPHDGNRVPYRSYAVHLWDLTSGRRLGCLADELWHAPPLAFSADGKLCVIGGLGCSSGLEPDEDSSWSAKLFDVKTLKEVQQLSGDEIGPVTCVAFAPDARSIAIGTHRSLTLWDLRREKPGRIFLHNDVPYEIRSLEFSGDGKHLLVSGVRSLYPHRVPKEGNFGRLMILHGGSGRELQRLAETWVISGAFFPDGVRVLAAIDHQPTILGRQERLTFRARE